MTRGILIVSSVAAAAMLALAPSAAATKSPRSACDISGQEQDLGASYVTSLRARNTSCGKAIKVTIAYNECRKANGGPGSRNCPGKASGFSCSTNVVAESSAQFDAKFSCHRGDKKVKGTYTQNF